MHVYVSSGRLHENSFCSIDCRQWLLALAYATTHDHRRRRRRRLTTKGKGAVIAAPFFLEPSTLFLRDHSNPAARPTALGFGELAPLRMGSAAAIYADRFHNLRPRLTVARLYAWQASYPASN